MIIPKGIRPEFSLYYLGAKLLSILSKSDSLEHDIFELFEAMKKQTASYSFSQHLMALNWLYLLDAVCITAKGRLKLC